MMQKCHINKV